MQKDLCERQVRTSLNKIIIVIALAVAITSIITIPSITEQFVDAKSIKKIHFTQTITSSQDPGKGHESHQLARKTQSYESSSQQP